MHNKLTPEERANFLDNACTKEVASLSADKIVPILASRGEYLGSERTLGRLLKIEKMNKHRRREKPAATPRPLVLVATGPNQEWSWDVTYLPSRVIGKHFYCFLFLDIFSRKIVGWEVHEKECGKLASSLLMKTCKAEMVDHGSLALRQDNGAMMRGAEFVTTMATLGVTASYSRPGVFDDNPFSESIFGVPVPNLEVSHVVPRNSPGNGRVTLVEPGT